MKQKDSGLGNIGQDMTPLDNWILQQISMSDATSVAIVGPGDKRNLYEKFTQIKSFKEVNMYDYDPQRAGDGMITCDVVFDIELEEELIINYACEKMWPLGKIYKGREFILIGDNARHHGDCNPIITTRQLIKQNELTEVWSFNQLFPNHPRSKLFMVYGCN